MYCHYALSSENRFQAVHHHVVGHQCHSGDNPLCGDAVCPGQRAGRGGRSGYYAGDHRRNDLRLDNRRYRSQWFCNGPGGLRRGGDSRSVGRRAWAVLVISVPGDKLLPDGTPLRNFYQSGRRCCLDGAWRGLQFSCPDVDLRRHGYGRQLLRLCVCPSQREPAGALGTPGLTPRGLGN